MFERTAKTGRQIPQKSAGASLQAQTLNFL
jgi:hypothetical protein